MNLRHHSVAVIMCLALLLGTVFVSPTPTKAQTIDQLQSQITAKNAQLDQINADIKKYESELNKVGAEKSTLQDAINQLELQRKKIQADVSYTQNKISATDLTISKLTLQMQDTQSKIDTNKASIAAILRTLEHTDGQSYIELLLGQQNVAELWNEISNLETVRSNLADNVTTLKTYSDTLATQRDQNTSVKASLVSLKKQYSDQQDVLVNNQNDKETLLKETKSKESNYQQLLADQKAAKDKLEAEVTSIESQIKFILNPNTIPPKGTPVLQWPLKHVIITQYFGYTKFALSGAYSGSKHNGIDLGTPVGTPVHAPLSGTVRDTGNTDLVKGCYSWGKWILLDHANGLSSLFAHLSVISVVPGQHVSTGDIIGYTGMTGYTTGPHLHYTVYVQAAVQVKQFNQFKSVTHCGPAKSPFAAIEGYLNPLDYLPPIPKY